MPEVIRMDKGGGLHDGCISLAGFGLRDTLWRLGWYVFHGEEVGFSVKDKLLCGRSYRSWTKHVARVGEGDFYWWLLASYEKLHEWPPPKWGLSLRLDSCYP